MSRHGKIQLIRSKAFVLVAAGALSVATAAAATAAAWPAGPHGHPARPPASQHVSQQASVTVAQLAQAIRQAQAQDAITLAKVTRTQAARPAVNTVNTVTRSTASPRQIAKAMLRSFRWSARQFSCLDPLWEHESGWRVTAYNPYSGAYGIPQALPGWKMASAGPNWRTNATTQIRWGLRYIRARYGTPCGAWAHEEATGWY